MRSVETRFHTRQPCGIVGDMIAKPAKKSAKIEPPAAAAQPTEPVPKPAASPAPKTKILIIDDDSFMAGMYATRFTADGFETVTATDGILGIEKARKEMPDVILLDVLMPKMDGFETLARLKADPTLAPIPVLMLTSMGQKEDVERGLNGGATDYMVKTNTLPVDASEKIKKVLQKRK